MNILFLNHNLIWRGSFFRCMGFARELVKLGHRVEIWTVPGERLPFGKRETVDGVHLWQPPRWGGVGKHDGGYEPLGNLCRLLTITRPHWDIIHAFEHRPNVFFPWIWKKQLTRFSPKQTLFMADWSDWWTTGGIISSKRRFPWIDRAERRIEEKSKSWAHGVTVISRTLYDRARSLKIPSDKIALIPSGVSLESFPCLERETCRSKMPVPPNKRLLGFVGFSLWDMRLLSDTFMQIRQQRDDVCLMVIGGGVEEAQKDFFRSRFTIGKEVLLPGVVPFEQLPRMLGGCDLLLLPMEDSLANRARLPNKLMDYFAAGRPIVVTDIGDAPRYVEQHHAGRVCPPHAAAMANTCIELLSQPNALVSMGQNARLAAEKRYAYSTLVQQWITFYQMQLKKS